jgi:hypothetical protein
VLSSLAGILYVSQLSVADPQTSGRAYELNAIAAAVVGGCSLQGGVGTIPGTLLGSLFLRVVIDGVANIIKTGADVYEGLIVGVLVVFAVTFTRGPGTTSIRRKLFAGSLGWVTLLNLTILSGVMMALLGSKLIEGRTQLDPTRQAGLAAAATISLLLLIRSSLASATKRRMGMVWAALVIVTVIGCDRSYPGIQRRSAMSLVQSLGGQITQGDDGIIVDLNQSRCDDATLKRLIPRLKFFPNLAELQMRDTSVTDSGLDAIRKAWEKENPWKRLDVTGSKASTGGMARLKRSFEKAEVLPRE